MKKMIITLLLVTTLLGALSAPVFACDDTNPGRIMPDPLTKPITLSR